MINLQILSRKICIPSDCQLVTIQCRTNIRFHYKLNFNKRLITSHTYNMYIYISYKNIKYIK